MRRKMTKEQVLREFRELYSDWLKENRGDVIAKREEWNNYTDMLCKDGYISNHQYDTWSNPF